MDIDSAKIKETLEMMAKGATCDYQAVNSGVIIINEQEMTTNGLDINIFLQLRNLELIDKTKQLIVQFHPIFRPSHSNPIERYEITAKGREYLAKH